MTASNLAHSRSNAARAAETKGSMSLDRSLKISAKLTGKRSVMKRDERIAKMITDKKFDEKKGALGIPKTLVGKA